jgi:proline dehydrogenase
MLLRPPLLYLSRSKNLERFIKVNPWARRAASRFVAGKSRDEALRVSAELNRLGFKVTLDYLGEEVRRSEDARLAAEEQAAAVEAAASAGLDLGLSVKLSHLGMLIDEGLAEENLRMICQRSAAAGRFVRVDMEGSALTSGTLEMVQRVHDDIPVIGTVIQSALKRSSADIETLNRKGISVRLVKGAYLEPSDLAFQRREEVTLYFMRLTESLLRDGYRPAIATHDELLIDYAIDMAFIYGCAPEEFEFQMLYGIRRDLQEKLRDQGYRVRIYLPYGSDWYGYFMRRLAERPANLWFLLRHLRN